MGGPFGRAMIEAGRRRAQERAEAREAAKTKLLPPDTDALIQAACERERATLLARLDAIDAELARIRGDLAELQAHLASPLL